MSCASIIRRSALIQGFFLSICSERQLSARKKRRNERSANYSKTELLEHFQILVVSVETRKVHCKPLASIKDSPFFEVLKKKGFEVLLLVGPINRYAINQLKGFGSKKPVYVCKEGLELEETEEEKKACEEEAKWFEEPVRLLRMLLAKRSKGS